MAEFSSLNGYTVKDTTARNIAKGRNQAVTFVDYATMIEALNEKEKDEYKAGQNIYIGVVGVPDLWVYSVEDIRHTFEYVSDEEVVEKMTAYTTIQVGFFKLAMLEGQKVDLTTYDQHLAKHDDDIAELNESVNNLLLIKTVNSNSISLSSNTSNSFTFQIEKIEGYKPIIAFYASNIGGGSVVIPTRASELLDDTMTTFTLGARNIGTNNQNSVNLIANILYQRINQPNL